MRHVARDATSSSGRRRRGRSWGPALRLIRRLSRLRRAERDGCSRGVLRAAVRVRRSTGFSGGRSRAGSHRNGGYDLVDLLSWGDGSPLFSAFLKSPVCSTAKSSTA